MAASRGHGEARRPDWLLGELARQPDNAALISATALTASRIVARYIDLTSESMVAAHDQESLNWARKLSAARAARIRGLISGERVSASETEAPSATGSPTSRPSPRRRSRSPRETLLVFLHSGGSYKTTAEQLTLHRNTVQYRIRKAGEGLGRPVGEKRQDVELALRASRWLGSYVLRPPAAGGSRDDSRAS